MKHIFLGFQIILNKTRHANFYSTPICTQIKQSPPFGLSVILLREIKVFSTPPQKKSEKRRSNPVARFTLLSIHSSLVYLLQMSMYKTVHLLFQLLQHNAVPLNDPVTLTFSLLGFEL